MVVDLSRSGGSSMTTNNENIDKIKKQVLEDHRRQLAQEVNISSNSVHYTMIDFLGMKRFAARLVPKDLQFLQKAVQ